VGGKEEDDYRPLWLYSVKVWTGLTVEKEHERRLIETTGAEDLFMMLPTLGPKMAKEE